MLSKCRLLERHQVSHSACVFFSGLDSKKGVGGADGGGGDGEPDGGGDGKAEGGGGRGGGGDGEPDGGGGRDGETLV